MKKISSFIVRNYQSILLFVFFMLAMIFTSTMDYEMEKSHVSSKTSSCNEWSSVRWSPGSSK